MAELRKINLKEGEKVAGIATLLTFSLALGKGIVGFFSGSMALMTDALHSTVDILTIFSAWAGLKIANRPPTGKFPYGYHKAENLATLFISIIIIILAIELMLSSYDQLWEKPEIKWGIAALIIPLISAILSFGISRYEIKVGKKINSQALIANGKESLMDVFSSVIVFIAIGGTLFGAPYLDGIAGIIISLLILKIGIETIKDSLFSLMDVSPGKDIERKISKELKKIKGIESYSDLKLRKSGPFIFGEIKIKTKKSIDITRTHELTSMIEKRLKNKIKNLESITIHFEPSKKEKQKICIPIKKNKGLKSEIEEKIGRAKKFMSIELEKGKIRKKYVKENIYKTKEHLAGLSTSKFLIKEKIDALITKEIGEITFHTLRDSFIEIYKPKTDIKTIKQILKDWKKKRVELITKPTKKSEG